MSEINILLLLLLSRDREEFCGMHCKENTGLIDK